LYHQYDNPGIVDGAHDLVSVKGSGNHISRRNPARKARTLERENDGIGNGRILGRVADKNIMRFAAQMLRFRLDRVIPFI
jgi:hypothetical protein